LATVLILAISACSKGKIPPLPQVTSLRDNLPALEEVARRWSRDAYLASADIPLLDGNPAAWAIAANFQSPSRPSEVLLVRLGREGKIIIEVLPYSFPVTQVEPIGEDDWSLDSAEALEAAVDDEGRRFLEKHSDQQCSHMIFERSRDLPDRRVVWWLWTIDCNGGKQFQQLAGIDALSGEVFRRD
jgi:hypothetical protein